MTREKIIEYTIGYKPEVFHYDEVMFETQPDETIIRINYLGMERDFQVEFGEWFPLEWKDDEEEDSYEPFTTQDLMYLFDSFVEINVCSVCEGERHYEIQRECGVPASECCGGCVRYVECDCLKSEKLFPY